MKVVDVDITKIIPYQNNPRNNELAIPKVAESIKQFGFRQPIVVDKDNVVVAGHTRLEAAKSLKMKKVPVVIADDLTPAQVKAFRLVDNKVAEFSSWDFDVLSVELDDLLDIDMSDLDMSAFGFDLGDNFGESVEPTDREAGGGTSSFNYKEQYGVIVMCKDEAEQEKVYTRLMGEGFECKVVAV